MPTTVSLWALQADGSVDEIPPGRLDLEEQIEDAIEKSPGILGGDVLIIGRQVSTSSGPLDLLALDDENHLVVIENKRDRTPREVTAQVLDYASWASKLTLDDIEEIYEDYRGRIFDDEEADLSAAYAERFECDLEDPDFPPRMVIVASRLDEATERMIDFLADGFGVPIDAVLFQPFNLNESIDGTVIGKTQLRPEEPSVSIRKSGRSRERSLDRHEFWKRWFAVARPSLPELSLDYVGTSSYISRVLESGVPVTIRVWVSASSAYPQICFRDKSGRTLNVAMIERMMERQASIEEHCGQQLTWINQLDYTSTFINSPRIDIGSIADPDTESLERLTEATRRLLDAVSPHVKDVYREATDLLQREGPERIDPA